MTIEAGLTTAPAPPHTGYNNKATEVSSSMSWFKQTGQCLDYKKQLNGHHEFVIHRKEFYQ